jgi:hypothetical protein
MTEPGAGNDVPAPVAVLTVMPVLLARAAGLAVSKPAAGHSIGIVAGSSRAGATGRERRFELALTRRRAVDFCRVATALC